MSYKDALALARRQARQYGVHESLKKIKKRKKPKWKGKGEKIGRWQMGGAVSDDDKPWLQRQIGAETNYAQRVQRDDQGRVFHPSQLPWDARTQTLAHVPQRLQAREAGLAREGGQKELPLNPTGWRTQEAEPGQPFGPRQGFTHWPQTQPTEPSTPTPTSPSFHGSEYAPQRRYGEGRIEDFEGLKNPSISDIKRMMGDSDNFESALKFVRPKDTGDMYVWPSKEGDTYYHASIAEALGLHGEEWDESPDHHRGMIDEDDLKHIGRLGIKKWGDKLVDAMGDHMYLNKSKGHFSPTVTTLPESTKKSKTVEKDKTPPPAPKKTAELSEHAKRVKSAQKHAASEKARAQARVAEMRRFRDQDWKRGGEIKAALRIARKAGGHVDDDEKERSRINKQRQEWQGRHEDQLLAEHRKLKGELDIRGGKDKRDNFIDQADSRYRAEQQYESSGTGHHPFAPGEGQPRLPLHKPAKGPSRARRDEPEFPLKGGEGKAPEDLGKMLAEEAARQQRAQKMGFTTPLYRGVEREPRHRPTESRGHELKYFMTDNPHLANRYAQSYADPEAVQFRQDTQMGEIPRPQVQPILANTKDYMEFKAMPGSPSAYGQMDDFNYRQRMFDEAREAGAPGVVFRNVVDEPPARWRRDGEEIIEDERPRFPGSNVYVALDPSTVRGKYAKFRDKDSEDIMSARGGAIEKALRIAHNMQLGGRNNPGPGSRTEWYAPRGGGSKYGWGSSFTSVSKAKPSPPPLDPGEELDPTDKEGMQMGGEVEFSDPATSGGSEGVVGHAGAVSALAGSSPHLVSLPGPGIPTGSPPPPTMHAQAASGSGIYDWLSSGKPPTVHATDAHGGRAMQTGGAPDPGLQATGWPSDTPAEPAGSLSQTAGALKDWYSEHNVGKQIMEAVPEHAFTTDPTGHRHITPISPEEIEAGSNIGVAGEMEPHGGVASVMPKRGMAAVKSLRDMPYNQALDQAKQEPHLIKSPDGGYVGAPDSVKSPRDIDAMRDHFDAAVEKGIPGSQFYKQGRQMNQELAGPDPARQRLLAQEEGKFSSQSGIDQNLGDALRAHNAYEAGTPAPIVKTGQQARSYAAARDAGQDIPLGPKTGVFAEHLDPTASEPATGTNDIWHARAMKYTNPGTNEPFSGTPSPAQHAFMDHETVLATDRANQMQLNGRSDWTPGEIQAAAWHGVRTDQPSAGKGFPDYAEKYTAKATHEAIPYAGSGHMEGIVQAPAAVRAEYSQGPGASWTTPEGRDVIHDALGMYQRPALQGLGSYEGEHNPLTISRPMVGFEGPPGARHIDPASEAMLNKGEALRSYADVQGATPWTVTSSGKAGASDSIKIPTGGKLQPEQMKQLEAIGKPHGVGDIIDQGDHVLMTSFGEPAKGAELGKALKGDLGAKLRQMFAGAPQRVYKAGSGYPGYEGTWEKGVGSGAATKRLFEYLNAPGAPAAVAKLDRDPNVRTAIWNRLHHDAVVQQKHGFKPREDVQNARRILSTEGPNGGIKGLLTAWKDGKVLLPEIIGPVLLEQFEKLKHPGVHVLSEVMHSGEDAVATGPTDQDRRVRPFDAAGGRAFRRGGRVEFEQAARAALRYARR